MPSAEKSKEEVMAEVSWEPNLSIEQLVYRMLRAAVCCQDYGEWMMSHVLRLMETNEGSCILSGFGLNFPTKISNTGEVMKCRAALKKAIEHGFLEHRSGNLYDVTSRGAGFVYDNSEKMAEKAISRAVGQGKSGWTRLNVVVGVVSIVITLVGIVIACIL